MTSIKIIHLARIFALLLPNIVLAQDLGFKELCKTAKETVIAQPTTPIHSIAWDWNDAPFSPGQRVYYVNPEEYLDSRKLIKNEITPSVYLDFEEERINRTGIQYAHRADGLESYIRITPGQRYARAKSNVERVSTLTADALVTTTVTTTSAPSIFRYYLTVVDRRDKKMLGNMLYYVDVTNDLSACGPQMYGTVNPYLFVLKVLGFKYIVQYSWTLTGSKRPQIELFSTTEEAEVRTRTKISPIKLPLATAVRAGTAF